MAMTIADGVTYLPGYLDRAAQEALRDTLRKIVAEAPLFAPTMPRTGKPFSVKMTNCGPLGWVSDKDGGYRYQPTHPVTGQPWPAIPDALMAAWSDLADFDAPPEACLINFYGPKARMGLHKDSDEEEFAAPVVSMSLGDTGVFRVGGQERKAPTRSVKLSSGDAIVLAGPARLAYHGIDRIVPDTSTLLKGGGRINLTLRRVTEAV